MSRTGPSEQRLFGALVVIGQRSFVEVEGVLGGVLIQGVEVDVVALDFIDFDQGVGRLPHLPLVGAVACFAKLEQRAVRGPPWYGDRYGDPRDRLMDGEIQSARDTRESSLISEEDAHWPLAFLRGGGHTAVCSAPGGPTARRSQPRSRVATEGGAISFLI